MSGARIIDGRAAAAALRAAVGQEAAAFWRATGSPPGCASCWSATTR